MIIKILFIIIIIIKLLGIFNGIYDIEFLIILSEVLEEHIINLSTGNMDDMGGMNQMTYQRTGVVMN